MLSRLEWEEAEQKKIDIGASAQFIEANNLYFKRECERYGVDPDRGLSPELLKIIGGKNALARF